MKVTKVKIAWNNNLSIYASEPFLKTVGDEYGWIGGFDDTDRLCCVLPYTIIQKNIFRMARFRIETIPLISNFDLKMEKVFLNHVLEYLRTLKVDIIIPATTNTIFRVYPDGAIAAPYGTYIINLRNTEDAIWGNLSASHRRKVRLAIKKGVKIKSGLNDVNLTYKLIRDTFKRSGLGFMDLKKFIRYIRAFGENIKIFIAEYQGEVQSCAVIPFSNYGAYYVYGGSIYNPITGSTNLMHWEAIQYFNKIGVKRYDFVGVRINPQKGSKQEGLKNYKERFGGDLIQGYIWKYSFKPLKFAVYSLAVKIIRGGDIVDHEHSKLKEFQNLNIKSLLSNCFK